MADIELDSELGVLLLALEQNFISLIVTDPKGIILYVNETFISSTGFNRNEAIGKDLKLFFTDNKYEAIVSKIIKKINNDRSWTGEVKNKRKNGKYYWESVTITPYINKKGIHKYFICTKKEITPKRKSEWEYVFNESRFRSFFSKSNAKIVIFDPDSFKIIDANEAALNFYGYTVQELIDLDIKSEFVGFAEAIKAEIHDRNVGHKNVYAQKHRLKDGEFHDVEIFPALMEFNDKDLIYIIVQDISQRKKAIKALKESESKKLALLKIMPDLIFVLNRNGEFVDVYTDQPDRIGIPPQRLLGKKCEQVFPLELSFTIKEKLDIAIKTREVQSFEYRYKRDLRKYIFEEIRIISTGDEEVLVIMRDITEGKQAQLRLKKAMEEAREANSIKSAFIANISHEIRTPINSILGFSDLLAAELKTESQLKNIDSIKSSSKTLLNLINDILDLSKIEAGKMTVKYHDVKLSTITEEIENIFSLKVATKALEYVTKIDKSVPDVVRFDEMRLKQILMNLVSNAIKFTDEGSVRLEVTAKNISKRDFVEYVDLQISVEDSGIGIKKENQDLIFEAFKQQDEQDTRKYGGTGLGLTITKRLVELLKGRMEMDSEPGKGSVFILNFPEVEVSKHGYIDTIKSDNIKIGQYIFKPACILIADEDKNNRDILCGIFRYSNIDFLIAENGKKAIKLIKTKKPDLALLSIQMSKIDGLDVARFIKTNKNFKDITTIGVSASPLTYNSDIRCVYLDDFVSKPVNLKMLLRKLMKFLEIEDDKLSSLEEGGISKTLRLEGELFNLFRTARNNEIRPAIIRMSNTSSFRDYEYFGKVLVRIGEELDISRLSNIGIEINRAVKSFDLESLAKLVTDYKIFEKKLLNDSNEEF
jgi:PAS domain S-box-containing protein